MALQKYTYYVIGLEAANALIAELKAQGYKPVYCMHTSYIINDDGSKTYVAGSAYRIEAYKDTSVGSSAVEEFVSDSTTTTTTTDSGTITTSTTTKSSVDPGDTFDVLVYTEYDREDIEAWAVDGSEVAFVQENIEQKTEHLYFTNGQGTASYPVNELISPVDLVVSSFGQQELEYPTYKDDDSKYYIPVEVTYNTSVIRYRVTVPNTWPLRVFPVWFKIDGQMHVQSANVNTAAQQGVTQKEVTIVVKDYSTDAIIAGANIWIDGVYAGVSDSQGKLTKTLTVGTHTWKSTASGYVDTDVDTLSNEAFSVS